jgi:hypothetical protein
VLLPLGAQTNGNEVTVRARLTGDFTESPVELNHIFKLKTDKIASLEIRSFQQVIDFGPGWRVQRLDHGSDVTILENRASVLPCSANGGIYHGLCQKPSFQPRLCSMCLGVKPHIRTIIAGWHPRQMAPHDLPQR